MILDAPEFIEKIRKRSLEIHKKFIGGTLLNTLPIQFVGDFDI